MMACGLRGVNRGLRRESNQADTKFHKVHTKFHKEKDFISAWRRWLVAQAYDFARSVFHFLYETLCPLDCFATICSAVPNQGHMLPPRPPGRVSTPYPMWSHGGDRAAATHRAVGRDASLRDCPRSPDRRLATCGCGRSRDALRARSGPIAADAHRR